MLAKEFEATETGGFENGDGVVVIVDSDVGFVHAVEGEMVDLFVGHEDLVTFVADAEKRMGTDKLGFKMSDAFYGSVDQIYHHYYGVSQKSVNTCPEIVLGRCSRLR